MRPANNFLSISAARTDALFVSSLQRSDAPSAGQIRQSVAAAVRQFGTRGCAGRVAQEFGEHQVWLADQAVVHADVAARTGHSIPTPAR